ncbi:hypothetical protein [Streptomyces sp. NPDC057676]
MTANSDTPMIAGPRPCSWLPSADDLGGWHWRYAMLAQHIRVITQGMALVPHADRTRGPGPRWAHPWGAPTPPTRWLAHALSLSDDLATAWIVHHGPLPERPGEPARDDRREAVRGAPAKNPTNPPPPPAPGIVSSHD